MWESFDAVADLAMRIERPATIGYNSAKAMLLRAFLLDRQGAPDVARPAYADLLELFKRVAADTGAENAALFDDVELLHRASYLGMPARRQIDGVPLREHQPVTAEIVGRVVFRLRSQRAVGRLRRALAAMTGAA